MSLMRICTLIVTDHGMADTEAIGINLLSGTAMIPGIMWSQVIPDIMAEDMDVVMTDIDKVEKMN
jgi:hypothetical protein